MRGALSRVGSVLIVLCLDLVENQPTIIPTSSAGGVPNHQPFGFIQAFRAERVILRKTAQLAQKVIGIDVMSPSTGHGLRDFGRVQVCEDLLDTTEFGESVDTPGAEGMNKLIFVTLKTPLSALPPL